MLTGSISSTIPPNTIPHKVDRPTQRGDKMEMCKVNDQGWRFFDRSHTWTCPKCRRENRLKPLHMGPNVICGHCPAVFEIWLKEVKKHD